ncbi:MAG: prepilin-type N-terminal cleavage/methylation domain-containing protein [Clostridia bacterium]|mgnify:CR=1 FL=1|nr:prepilin-type N-terminal cleavage/methylation domain-containing protein [Clostridia bacterium]
MRYKDERGFTLLELIIAVSLMSLLVVGLHQITVFSLSSWRRAEQEVDIQQNVALAVNHLSRELRSAREVRITDGRYDIYFRLTGGKRIRYYLNNQQLLRDVNGNGHNIVAYGIKRVHFKELVENSMIYIEIQGITGYGLATAVHLRSPEMEMDF